MVLKRDVLVLKQISAVGAAATGEEVVLAALDEGDLDEGDEEGVLLELVELVPSHLRSPLENLS